MQSLPPEVIQLIVNSLDSHHRYPLLSLRIFHHSARYIQFRQPTINSLKSFDLLLTALEQNVRNDRDRDLATDEALPWRHVVRAARIDRSRNDRDLTSAEALPWRHVVHTVKIECSQHGVKGWGVRIGRLNQLCSRIQHLEVIGVEDFRMRSLLSSSQCPVLNTLVLRSTTFKPHSLPSPPGLHSALSRLTSLTLSNIGLPYPSTHSLAILSSAPRLTQLHLSGLRDLTQSAIWYFTEGLHVIAKNLRCLTIGSLSADQSDAFAVALPNFTSLTSLFLTLPLPLSIHIAALPPRLVLLSVRRHSSSRLEEEWATIQAVVDMTSDKVVGPLQEVRLWKGIRGARTITEKLKLSGVTVSFTN